ncbi:metal-dependent transcriptional regulator [Mycoplasmatota bacterium]|nr:metal-dependent transcriptional regulator [Mycoplasmatota bacterium]
MQSKESREMYLEVILKLSEKNDVVRSIDIANELNYSKPSISRAMKVLKQEGYITQLPYGDIKLTQKGLEKAKKIYNIHNLITDFLVKTLKIDKITAEKDACRIEHVISQETVDAIEQYLIDN